MLNIQTGGGKVGVGLTDTFKAYKKQEKGEVWSSGNILLDL